MMSLNKLPDGSPSPKYSVTAKTYDGESEATEIITEWWYEGKQVCSIEESAKDFFYSLFDKHAFTITSIQLLATPAGDDNES